MQPIDSEKIISFMVTQSEINKRYLDLLIALSMNQISPEIEKLKALIKENQLLASESENAIKFDN